MIQTTTTTENSSGVIIDGHEYKDEGCEIFPSCLRCPLPKCKYDDPRFARAHRRRQLEGLVLRAHLRDGLSVPEAARRFGISRRTIYRILRRNRYGTIESAPNRSPQRLPASASLR